MRSARRFIVAITISGIVSGSLAGSVLALPYDGTNPGATACGDGSHTVYVLDSANILSSTGTIIGKVELRQSVFCATVWSRVYNLTSASVDVRERLITYASPNGTGATTYTETDTLSKKGGATDSGWSKQYRDRPSFRAKGEIFYGGVWRTAQTDRSNMWNQFDGNFPNSPNTCDDTANDYCHRWPTTSTGGPVTVSYAFDTASLAILPTSPVSDINDVLQGYENLSGGSPDFSVTAVDYEDVLFYAYNDLNDIAYARSQSYFTAAFPQYYYYGYTKINKAKVGNTTNWNPLMCHEIGHMLGLMHVTEGGFVGSKATCMGAEFQGPYIDDQFLLTEIYSTPLAGS